MSGPLNSPDVEKILRVELLRLSDRELKNLNSGEKHVFSNCCKIGESQNKVNRRNLQ